MEEESRGVYDKPMYKRRVNGKSAKAYGKPKKLSEVAPTSISVEGEVVCLDCKYVGTGMPLTDAKPLAGAEVKLVCRTGVSFFYTTASTDSNGFFLILVPYFDFQKFTPGEDCMAFSVSSPLKDCSTVTDINSGKTGSPLRAIPTFAPSSNLMYSAGPFAFAPKLCS
ncbi:hypothetical protein L7F22_036815 [Adiantum nelumboides]|nr:hypothetical protein [Adiantum nelumboides]